jgi:hypothetical protein
LSYRRHTAHGPNWINPSIRRALAPHNVANLETRLQFQHVALKTWMWSVYPRDWPRKQSAFWQFASLVYSVPASHGSELVLCMANRWSKGPAVFSMTSLFTAAWLAQNFWWNICHHNDVAMKGFKCPKKSGNKVCWSLRCSRPTSGHSMAGKNGRQPFAHHCPIIAQ